MWYNYYYFPPTILLNLCLLFCILFSPRTFKVLWLIQKKQLVSRSQVPKHCGKINRKLCISINKLRICLICLVKKVKIKLPLFHWILTPLVCLKCDRSESPEVYLLWNLYLITVSLSHQLHEITYWEKYCYWSNIILTNKNWYLI